MSQGGQACADLFELVEVELGQGQALAVGCGGEHHAPGIDDQGASVGATLGVVRAHLALVK